MARRTLTALAVLIALAACGSPEDPQVQPSPGEPSPSGTASEPEAEPTGEATPSAPNTTAPESTASDDPSRLPLDPPAAPQPAADTLDDGRPATFLAVSVDYEAVEVDTATGAVLRSLGQMDDRADVERAEVAAATNVISGVWRTWDASWYLISECCEPAGGAIHRLRPGQALTSESHDDLPMTDGWHITPLPGGDEILTTGYVVRIGPVGNDPWFEATADELLPASPGVWEPQERRALWLFRQHPGWALASAADGQITRTELDWAGDGQELSGLARQASGGLVTIRYDVDGESSRVDSSATGIVFSPTGELTATFPVEPGSSLGGYDPSGRFLIYTDGDGAVRWQGPGGGGELAGGYIFASW